MQSAQGKSGRWTLQFEPEAEHTIDPIMGWSGGDDVYASQVTLIFDTLEEAKNYAINNKIEFTVSESYAKAPMAQSYLKIFLKNISTD
jgi:hypothetical protein